MITQSGPQCDVCGKFILLDRSINPFTIPGISGTLLAHDKCKVFVEGKRDWRQLPDGPLRKVFEEAHCEQEEVEESGDLEERFDVALKMPEMP